MRVTITTCILLAMIPLLTSVHRSPAADEQTPTTQPYDWKALDKVVGAKGTLKDDVYTYVLPRNDLDVAVDSMEVPAAAGVSSQFYFFRCSCGKIRVVGQFCCADYEANDVMDALRAGAMIQISSVGPMFISDKPRITIVRFQGEGDGSALAQLLKSALSWVGDARSAPLPVHH